MTTEFDAQVRKRQEETPWARMSMTAFAHEMCANLGDISLPGFQLEVRCRPSVVTGYWYTVKWVGADQGRYEVSSQSLDLCLWRAAEQELERIKKVNW